jgi:hypothetical protein
MMRRANSSNLRFVCGCIFCVIFLQRIALPLGGSISVSASVPGFGLALIYLFMTGRAFYEMPDFALMVTFLTVCVTASLISSGIAYSVPSMLLLMFVYVTWGLRIPLTDDEYHSALKFFQSCMLVFVPIEAAQYLSQFAGLGMPILESVVPNSFLTTDFVYVQEIFWNAGIMRPNGIFMLEPSFLAQFLALALAIEVIVFQRKLFIVLYGIALTGTFGGTGFLIAAMLLPRLLIQRSTRWFVIGFGAVLLATAWGSGMLNIIGNRANEMSDPNQSGNGRFVHPYERVIDTIVDGDLTNFLFGHGPGWLDRPSGSANPPTAKIWVEYGFPAFLTFMAYCLRMFFRNLRYPELSITLFTAYAVVAGGSLLQSAVLYVCFFLGTGYAVYDQRDAPLTARDGVLLVAR